MAAKKFFKEHHVDFVNYLNIEEVIPFLNKQLLTTQEMEKLDSLQTRRVKIKYLIKIMCIKGDQAPSLFIQCVRDAEEHLAHPELADKMEKWLQKHSAGRPTNGSENATQTTHKLHQRSSTSNQTQSGDVLSPIDYNVHFQRKRSVHHEIWSTTTTHTTTTTLEYQAVQTAKVLIQNQTKNSLADLSTYLPTSSLITSSNRDSVSTAGPSTQRTPTGVSQTASTSPTQKRRKFESESEILDKDWHTPLTKAKRVPASITTTNKRSKVNTRMEADTFCTKEGGGSEGENPPQSINYWPGMLGDGFIVPEAKPTMESEDSPSIDSIESTASEESLNSTFTCPQKCNK